MGDPATMMLAGGTAYGMKKGGSGNMGDKLDPIQMMIKKGSKVSAGPAPPSPGDAMSQILSAYTSGLPGLFSAYGAGAPTLARGDLNAANATVGGYNDLALRQLMSYGLPMANVQAGIDRGLIEGEGGRAAASAQALMDRLTPENKLIRTKTGDLLNSFNMGGLSMGEQSAVERSLAQSNTATGNLGLDNATNAVSNAMNFGGAFNNKVDRLGNALNTATNAMAGQNQMFNPISFATGSNKTQPMTNLPQSNQAAQIGTNMLTNLGSAFNNQSGLLANYNWQASPRWAASDIGRNMGSMCCFIFLECLNGHLPWYVRLLRDDYYASEPSVANGYKRMSKWLVPLMRKSKLVKTLVNTTMVKPMITYGAYLMGINRKGKLLRPVKEFWFMIWRNS